MEVTDAFFVQAAQQQNARALSASKLLAAMAFGCLAGILGLQSLYGVLFFLSAQVAQLTAVVLLDRRCLRKLESPVRTIATTGLFEAVCAYLLFWTLFYNLVFIYA
ncbi:MAG: hypothetical protein MHM6MM_006447 [Cercozoa sp. M6MM]